MRVGGSVSVCGLVGKRVRGYVWFTCFGVLLSRPMVLSPPLTRRWSAAFELDSHLLLYVIAVPRYCCSTWVGGSLGRCVYVFVSGCVGGCVGSYVVDCVFSLLMTIYLMILDDLLFLFGVCFVRPRSGIVRRTTYGR